MSGQKSNQADKTLVIDIQFTRRTFLVVVGVTLAAALFAFAASYRENVQAATIETSTSGMRHYYLTKTSEWGAIPSDVCEDGYHMASLWEIADPSNLKYDTINGLQRPDSGQGPPAGIWGWVRTGYVNDDSSIVGRANCNGWTSFSQIDNGTRARLPDNWTAGYDDLNVWELSVYECDLYYSVWCVED